MNPVLQAILDLLGILLRFLGLLLFGVAAGWFTLDAFRKESWQVQVAALLGFFGLSAVVVRFATAGALGAFALGAGAALLFWGVWRKKGEPNED